MIILEFHCNSVQLLGGYIRFYAVLYAPVLPREKKMFLALGLTIVLPDTATLENGYYTADVILSKVTCNPQKLCGVKLWMELMLNY